MDNQDEDNEDKDDANEGEDEDEDDDDDAWSSLASGRPLTSSYKWNEGRKCDRPHQLLKVGFQKGICWRRNNIAFLGKHKYFSCLFHMRRKIFAQMELDEEIQPSATPLTTFIEVGVLNFR